MPEGHGNIDVAHQLHERGEKRGSAGEESQRHGETLEILEAIMLAMVAVATAWSGYQAARWDGVSAERYASATKYRVEAAELETLGGQDRLHDISTFNAWLQAKTTGSHEVASLLERRFSDDYLIAFKAWLRTDPLKNDSAPPGPMFMTEYRNPHEERAAGLNRQADEAFEAGRLSRETGEDYVRLTVFLATVLFLIAVSQRFRSRRVRQALLGVAGMFIGIAIYLLLTYPTA